MGKVIKAIAIIAIAIAVAVYAPNLGLAALQLFGSTAVAGSAAALAAGAVASVVLSTAAGLLINAVFASAPHTSSASGSQPSRGQPLERTGLTWSYPAVTVTAEMPPRGVPWWRDKLFLPWERFAIVSIRGECMKPIIAMDMHWALIDRSLSLRSDDIILFKMDDLASYLRDGGHDPKCSTGLIKRFVGLDPLRRVLIYETTFPPNRMETGINRLFYAYRVVSVHPTWWRAFRARLCRHRSRVCR